LTPSQRASSAATFVSSIMSAGAVIAACFAVRSGGIRISGTRWS